MPTDPPPTKTPNPGDPSYYGQAYASGYESAYDKAVDQTVQYRLSMALAAQKKMPKVQAVVSSIPGAKPKDTPLIKLSAQASKIVGPGGKLPTNEAPKKPDKDIPPKSVEKDRAAEAYNYGWKDGWEHGIDDAKKMDLAEALKQKLKQSNDK